MVVARRGALTLYLRPDLDADAVVEAFHEPGEPVSISRKSVVRRVGPWAIKESRAQGRLGALKHTLLQERYRRGWQAANYLQVRGVLVPQPHAFIEEHWRGLIIGNALVMDFLDGFHNVEEHARELVQQGASHGAIGQFLARLADAVNGLSAAGAYHADLSGKNIFTQDGGRFYFIDLDSVRIGARYTRSRRMKNHVQLYDSFCDCWSADLLDSFIARMMPEGAATPAWMKAVREGQRRRRARHDRRK